MKKFFLVISILSAISGFSQNPKVVVVVIDGARATEAFHDSTFQYVPKMHQLFSEQGTIFTNFKNNGVTNTCPGHTAITTGVYQEIDNNGLELPANPSMFQYYLKHSKLPSEKAWIVTSKGKLEVLSNTTNQVWNNQFKPKYNCGAPEGGHRNDTLTLAKAKEVLNRHEPNLMLVQFKEPDPSGHNDNWEQYLTGLKTSDSLTVDLWNFLQSHSAYKENTIMLVTNDHGRHTRHFAHHGDACDGCRNIFLLAIGNNIPVKQVKETFEQIDIPFTIAHWLEFDMPTGKGRMLSPLFD